MPSTYYKMTNEQALDFLKGHRDVLANPDNTCTLANYDIEAFDVAIKSLEKTTKNKPLNIRHRMTDHEFLEKVRKIADEYTVSDDYSYKFMEKIIDLLSAYDNGEMIYD